MRLFSAFYITVCRTITEELIIFVRRREDGLFSARMFGIFKNTPMKYKRILLKLSGEALMGGQNYGIDPQRLAEYAPQK